MSSGKILPRRQAVPVLYTRGTHYEVGFDMVSTPHAAHCHSTYAYMDPPSPAEVLTIAEFLMAFELVL